MVKTLDCGITPALVFHGSLSMSLQVSTTLLSILTDLNNALIWMVSARALISKSSCPFGDCTERINYHWYHRHFHVPRFFQFSSNVQVLFSLFTNFQFYPLVRQNGQVHCSSGLLFLLAITWCGRLAVIR